MVSGISSSLSAFYSANSYNSISASSVLFDYKAAQKQTQSLLDSYKSNNAQVQSLKADSAQFLDQYTLQMKSLQSSASKLLGDQLDKLLYDKSGQITDETVKDTVEAVQAMVDSYNSSLRLLNDNADRGAGVMDQIARMATDPAPAEAMKLVGVSVNDDGSLVLDAQQMTDALKTGNSDQLKLYKEIIGGSTGLALGVQKDARAGLSASAGSLIGNDLAVMQGIRQEDPLRSMASFAGTGAYALNNMAAAGMMMNFLV